MLWAKSRSERTILPSKGETSGVLRNPRAHSPAAGTPRCKTATDSGIRGGAVPTRKSAWAPDLLPIQEIARDWRSPRFLLGTMTGFRSYLTSMILEKVSLSQRRDLVPKEIRLDRMRVVAACQETPMASPPSPLDHRTTQTSWTTEYPRAHWTRTWPKLGTKSQAHFQVFKAKTHNRCIMIREQMPIKTTCRETGTIVELTAEISLNLTLNQLPKHYKMIIKVIIIIIRKWIKELITHHLKIIILGALESSQDQTNSMMRILMRDKYTDSSHHTTNQDNK